MTGLPYKKRRNAREMVYFSNYCTDRAWCAGAQRVARVQTGENMAPEIAPAMPLLTILQYPDPRLHTVAQPVSAFDDRLRQLAADMLETMYDSGGIGLAATQVDVHERLIVMDISKERNQPLVVVNPEIIWSSEARQLNEEGCLSVPGVYDRVERFESVHVRVWDLDGKARTIEAQDVMAICIQHEMDHLLGKVFVEYLSLLKRDRIKKKMRKAQREDAH